MPSVAAASFKTVRIGNRTVQLTIGHYSLSDTHRNHRTTGMGKKAVVNHPLPAVLVLAFHRLPPPLLLLVLPLVGESGPPTSLRLLHRQRLLWSALEAPSRQRPFSGFVTVSAPPMVRALPLLGLPRYRVCSLQTLSFLPRALYLCDFGSLSAVGGYQWLARGLYLHHLSCKH